MFAPQKDRGPGALLRDEFASVPRADIAATRFEPGDSDFQVRRAC
jgi:hypothetical protein